MYCHILQALHFQDALNENDTSVFEHFADDRIGDPGENVRHLMFIAGKAALQRHSKRPTSDEV